MCTPVKTYDATGKRPAMQRDPCRVRFCHRAVRATLALFCLWHPSGESAAWAETAAAPSVFRSFDGPGATWQLAESRRDVRLVGQACVGDDAREGIGCERVLLAAPAGESAALACPVGNLPVLDELEARLWVKANRPGVTLAARVVLPRSIDPASGAAKTVVIPGPQYGQVGRWQQLAMAQVPARLADRVRVMRTVPGANIDPREAYVDAIVLMVPGGVGPTAVWTDALAVDGILVAPPAQLAGATDRVELASHDSPVDSNGWRFNDSADSGMVAREAAVRMQGTTLMVDDRRFLPIGIAWNAEPLSYLADRGFNTVWTRQPPTREESDAAAHAGMWFVCPPPDPDTIATEGLRVPVDRVLAWFLGRPGDGEYEYYQRWAELVRENDPATGRPIVVAPRGDWLPYSKVADVLLAEHPAASRLSSTDYAEWLAGIALLARPGTPFWASVPTQAGESARGQLAVLLPERPTLAVVGDEQLDTLIRMAAVGGCRGLLFQSHTSLNLADDQSKRRAAALELVNRQLRLIDPWLTIGRNVGQVVSTDATTTASILQLEQSRLIMQLPQSTDANANTTTGAAHPPVPVAPSPNGAASLALIVPGVPISNEAFLLTPAGMRRLTAERVAGGMRVIIDRDANAMVLMTDDPSVVGSIRQRVAAGAQQAAVLERDLAVASAKLVPNASALPESSTASAGPLLAAAPSARSEIGRANAQLGAGNMDGAFRAASAARRLLAEAAKRQQRLVASAPPFSSTPLDAAQISVDDCALFQQRLAGLRAGENLLYGGDFEDLNQLTDFGWQHKATPLPGVEPNAELSGVEPYLGSYALRLSADAVPPGTAPQVVARSLIEITSPPVHVERGQVLEISGWVRVPQPIVGNIDGLSIVDSLGGEELAVRVRESNDWQPFRMIRAAPVATDLTITFALSGTGTALVDAVMVRPLTAAAVRRLPEATEPPGPEFPRSAILPRPLFAPPAQR
jgi:hypothetical protein